MQRTRIGLRIFRYSRIILGSGVLETYIPHLEITITIQSNDLTYHQPYTKKQQVVYELIRMLHEDKGLGYKKISKKLNSWGIKTHRGKKWFNTSVFLTSRSFDSPRIQFV